MRFFVVCAFFDLPRPMSHRSRPSPTRSPSGCCCRRDILVMAPSSKPKRVFLSHSSQDEQFVLRLETWLRRLDVDVWSSESSITPGGDWYDLIGQNLRLCGCFMIVLSRSSIVSVCVK